MYGKLFTLPLPYTKKEHTMTREQYQSLRTLLSDQENIIHKNQLALDQAYIKTSQIKAGDKVKVTQTNDYLQVITETICFVSWVDIPRSSDVSGFRYSLVKMKKDGTASSTSAGIYGEYTVEKMEQGK